MIGNISFTLLSFFYIALLTIIYFSKKRIKSKETKIYSYLIITTMAGVCLSLGTYFFMLHLDKYPILNFLFSKFYLIFILVYLYFMTLYVAYISYIKSDNKKYTEYYLFWIVTFIFLLLSIFVLFLPIEYYVFEKVVYSYGTSVSLVFTITRCVAIIWIVMLLLKKKKTSWKKTIPMVAYIVLGSIVSMVQRSHPEMLLSTAMIVFVTFLMYFTIENPDMQMIEQLNIAKDQADKANNAKTEFLSSMSHEIRTPLNAIDGFSQLILEENDIKVIKDEARDIMAASQNLLEIVNGILDISKIEADKLEIVNVEYEPSKIFDELAKLTKARIGEKPLEFRVNIAKDLPDYLNGDYVRLKQIVLNLLTNAVKYTKEGFVEFNVQAVKKDGVCRLIISVKDSGIGIKKDNIEKLFTKFERFDKEKNLTIEGTGLGLAITKKLVDLMHGKIVVDSVYGKGSTFTVSLDQKIVDKKKVKVADAEVKTTSKLNVKGKKVLIVDDNLINLKVAARLLEGYKLVTECVSSGFDCIKKIEEGNKYDLILMDDMMPKMSGVETFKKLKAMDNFKIPTIALTANAIAGMKEQYLKDGFNDYISKPIDKKELERVLKTYLK